MRNLLIIIALFAVISCSTTKEFNSSVVPTEVHTEYITKEIHDTTLIKDSIYFQDSVYIREKGDTVFYYKTQTKYKYNTLCKYLTKVDTLCKTDSIPYPVKVTEYKEVNKLTWLQSTLMYIGIISLILGLGFFIIKYIKSKLK